MVNFLSSWLECIGEMELTDAAAYAFTKKYFSEDSEQKVTILFSILNLEIAGFKMANSLNF